MYPVIQIFLYFYTIVEKSYNVVLSTIKIDDNGDLFIYLFFFIHLISTAMVIRL